MYASGLVLGVGSAVAVLAAVAAFLAVRQQQRLRRNEARTALEREQAALRTTAEAEANATRRKLELDARAATQAERRRLDDEALAQGEALAVRLLEAERRAQELERRGRETQVRVEALTQRETALAEHEDAARALRKEAEHIGCQCGDAIEKLAGETPAEIRQRMVSEWIETARAAAAERLRRVDASINDPEHVRTGKRVMDVAIQRYYGHYLTERLLTNVPIVPATLQRILGKDNEHLRAIEAISHVTLTPSETGESIRLEGQDSFGREIARRAIARFARGGAIKGGDPQKACQAIADELDREVFDMGKRAFKELEIPRAHPDIVKLVGKLNYRTSYTQNQWKHAIEAAFLCGMLAYELGLDVKLSRRAALLHDIGKALTHEIDGSHAVIGADLARRLGETEIVANAIGAHHCDEPFNSSYAYLVAASDAMSGGRPGARRQQDENYAERIQDLERIASTFQGVDHVYAVQGGREVRIHVKEGRVSDERAVELSTAIAHRISDEMAFPGQIKVTVIREVRAVEVAG